jgi:hypothetical protein
VEDIMSLFAFLLRLLSGSIRNIAGDRHGTSAVEFALVGPIFVVAIIPLADVAEFAVGVSEMQTAVRSSIQYAMNGGSDMSLAQTQGMTAWPNKPAGGALNAVRACFCSGLSNACNTSCANGDPPEEYVTVTALATFTGHTFSTQKTISQKVRIR